MADRATQFKQSLTGFVDGKVRLGAAVVTRDGLPVVSVMTRSVSDESFGAMAAAMLGAAESAMQEWMDERPAQAVVQSKNLRMEVEGLDADFILVAVCLANAQAAPMGVGLLAEQLRAILTE